MRTYDDTFSGQKLYPGKGKIFVRSDSKIFRFQNGKTESLFLQRKNPRRIAWTVLYRRQHKKGISEVRHPYLPLPLLPFPSPFSLPSSPPSPSHLPSLLITNSPLPQKQEVAKKRTRRTIKSQRGIVGASLDVIKERRAQRPEARAAAREAAIKDSKSRKRDEESKKKAEKAKSAGAKGGQGGRIQSKMGAMGKGGKVNTKGG
ncbi:pyridine nucleotide-disulfide oxidoreductase [Physcia stellaris]|nr:pyridine nucleotide-disulfide oxidoreductase [Physcia stellaris]